MLLSSIPLKEGKKFDPAAGVASLVAKQAFRIRFEYSLAI
jgi:hypothetical protein